MNEIANEQLAKKVNDLERAIEKTSVMLMHELAEASYSRDNANANLNDPKQDSEYWSYALRGAEDRYFEVRSIIEYFAGIVAKTL